MKKTLTISPAQIDLLQDTFGLSLIEVGDVVVFAHGGETPSPKTMEKLLSYYKHLIPWVPLAERDYKTEWVRSKVSLILR